MRPIAPVLFLVLLSACQQTPQPVATKDDSKEPIHQYSLHGEVLQLDPKDKIAKIKHQAITDGQAVWMGAMTMEFPVKDEKEFQALRAGEKIDATVYVQGDSVSWWLGQIHENTGAPAPETK